MSLVVVAFAVALGLARALACLLFSTQRRLLIGATALAGAGLAGNGARFLFGRIQLERPVTASNVRHTVGTINHHLAGPR